MKNAFAFIFLFLTLTASAQIVAPDFIADDCSGVPHHLYTELDSGKIVVMIWVMPCIGCVDGALAANSAVQNLTDLNPAGVLLYIVDDGPPSDCSTLVEWTGVNHIQKPVLFGNYANELNQDDFGGFGMPHIVVIGPDRQIYFNEKNGSGNGLYEAIQTAGILPATIKTSGTMIPFEIMPVPDGDKLKIFSSRRITKIDVRNLNGQIIKTFPIDINHENTFQVSISDLDTGIYLVQVFDKFGATGIKKTLVKKGGWN